MPRNVEENVYVTIGFTRCSPTWQRLQSEAKDLDISIPHLIKVLLADRTVALEGHGKHLWFPREVLAHPTAQTVSRPLTTASSSPEDSATRRATAAAAAADYWDD